MNGACTNSSEMKNRYHNFYNNLHVNQSLCHRGIFLFHFYLLAITMDGCCLSAHPSLKFLSPTAFCRQMHIEGVEVH